MTINGSYTLLTMLLNGPLKSTTNSLSPVITSLVVQPLIGKCGFSSMESLLDSCGNLNVICPHKPIGSSTIERCGFGVCMTLLEKVSHSRGGFEFLCLLRLLPGASDHFLLPESQDI